MSGKRKKQKSHLHASFGSAIESSKRAKKGSIKTGYLKYVLVVIALTAIIYFPSLNNGFTNFDDNIYVTENSLVTGQSPTKVSDIINTQVAGNYHPITIFSLAMNYKFSGLEPYSYHLVSLFFHLLNTVLVFLVVSMLFRERPAIALITALLFGIHPLHVESVAWVSARKDVLYVFFFLLGLMTYLKYIDSKRMLYYFLTLALMILSCASKPAAVIFPLILLAIDYFKNRTVHWKILTEKLLFFAISVFFGIITLKAQEASNAIGTFVNFGIFHRIMLASYGLMMYLVKLIIPTGLSALHPYPDFKEGIPVHFFASLTFVLAIVVLTFLSLRKTRVIAFGFLFYLFSLVLVLQFKTVGQAVIAERYTYLAYLGPFILIGYAYSRMADDTSSKLSQYKRPAQIVLILYAVTMAYTSFERTKIWKDSTTMWGDVIEKYPDDWYAYLGRANSYAENNEIEKSLADYNKIISLEPDKPEAYIGRGKVFRKSGQSAAALEDYNKSIRLDSFNSYAYNNRGNIYFERGENDLALADYNKSLSLEPGSSTTLNNIGSIHVRKGDFQSALNYYGKSLELNPLNAETYLNRSVVYVTLKKSDSASMNFEKYFRLIKEKATPHGWYWNGVNEQNRNRNTEAISSFNEAIRLSPQSGQYYLGRSKSYLAIGDKTKARTDAAKAIELGERPDEGYMNSLK